MAEQAVEDQELDALSDLADEEAEGQTLDESDVSESEEAEGEEESAAEKEPAEASFALDRRLTQAAHRAGFSDEQIQALGENLGPSAQGVFERLADGFDTVTRRLSDIATKERGAQEAGSTRSPGAPAGDTQSALKLELDPEVFSEEEAKALTKALKPLFDRVDAATQELGSVRQMSTAQVERALLREADAWFNSQDIQAELADFYGKGDTEAMDQTDDGFKHRGEVLQLANKIAAGAAQLGERVTFAQVMEDANSILTKGRQREMARSELKEKAAKRSKQITQRPSARKAMKEPPKGREKALASAKAKMQELGMLEGGEWK